MTDLEYTYRVHGPGGAQELLAFGIGAIDRGSGIAKICIRSAGSRFGALAYLMPVLCVRAALLAARRTPGVRTLLDACGGDLIVARTSAGPLGQSALRRADGHTVADLRFNAETNLSASAPYDEIAVHGEVAQSAGIAALHNFDAVLVPTKPGLITATAEYAVDLTDGGRGQGVLFCPMDLPVQRASISGVHLVTVTIRQQRWGVAESVFVTESAMTTAGLV
ncbi:hypothetical protein [Cryptosporangium minutisporangium]|uniref:Uncharacterized protein n=1 Tax=Cryptosporangium minutisporangium TaxID=113569 RepID=A0ABP6T6S2_9ACTN